MNFKYITFSTEQNHYLFDGVSCNIFVIDDALFYNHKHLIEQASKNTHFINKKYDIEYNELLEAIQTGSFLTKPKCEFEYWFNDSEYKHELKQGKRHLMIGVTEKCNMRCKYCVYSGHYKNERSHGNSSISQEVLFRSIDYFFENTQVEQKIINFYGGEPFIEFNQIESAVRYVQQKDPSVLFYITTNGTLINKSIAKWFIEHKTVHLYVSIAGTPPIHDTLRIFPSGDPTYQIVRKNLLNLRTLDNRAYVERIHFIFNLISESQLEELQAFYETEDIFKGIKSDPEITFIDCEEDDGVVRDLCQNIANQYLPKKNLFSKYIDLLKKRKYNNLIVKHYDQKMIQIHRRMLNDHRNVLTGVCRPFIHKMFVDIHGNVNLCENFSFGDTFGTIYNIYLRELSRWFSIRKVKPRNM